MKRSRVITGAVGAIAALALALSMEPALAAGADHTITGTAYENGNVYVSSTVRTKQGTGTVSAVFSALPQKGLWFEILTPQSAPSPNQVIGVPRSWDQAEITVSRTFENPVAGGTQFHNAFRLRYTCDSGCSPYNYVGTEHY